MDLNHLPKVSVLMPVYNSEAYIAEAIDSIINQSFEDWELIIIDDGSTDKSESIVKSYTDNRITFLKNPENKGIIYTRNRLFDKAKGEYMAIFDSDDISYPERLKKQVNFLDQNPEYAFCGTWGKTIDVDGKFLRNMNLANKHDYIKCWLLFSNSFIQSSIMIRKNVLDKNGLRYDEGFPVTGDYEFWARLIQYGKAENLKEYLVAYRWHASNISHRKKDKAKLLTQKTYARGLKTIGINPNEDELNTHFYKKYKDTDLDKNIFFRNLSTWLKKIAKAPFIEKGYKQDVFKSTICFKWIFICIENKSYFKILKNPLIYRPKILFITFKIVLSRI